ncbi:hypothetical protein PRIEUP_LOCUS359, partial [Pristimantis euphronides]
MESSSLTLEISWVQGINQKHVTFINPNTVCHPCGNFIVFTDIETKRQSLLPCGRIGAFTVNMRSEVVAFSDQKLPPSIQIFTFPGLVKRADLKGAAQLEYLLLAFSHSGQYLASYSSVPDHLLTVWNWQDNVPLCSVSDTSTNCTSLTFNPMDWHQLCLSGEEFLTFWNVEVCDRVYHLKSMPVKLTEDGVLAEEDGLQAYYGPQMPLPAIAGLIDDEAEGFIPKGQRRPAVNPSVHCWSSASHLFVGCKGGQLLSINPETQKMTALNLTMLTTAGELPRPDLYEGDIKAMALHRDGLYIGGSDGILWLCSIKSSEFKMRECWNAKQPIASLSSSPDYKVLSIATQKGSVYIYNYKQSENPVQVLNTCNDELIAAEFLTNGNKYSLSVGRSGGLHFWSSEDGVSISSLKMDVQATCMACCPSSHYAVIGSSSGHLFFVDAVKIKAPRIIARKRLYHVPVLHLHFDQKGNVLMTGAADGHIFILDARPSSSFQVIGYMVVGGDILSLSLLSSVDSQQIKVLALVCPMEKKEEKEGCTQLELFSLSPKILQSPSEYIDHHGMFKDTMIQKQLYMVEQPIFSAVLGSDTNSIYGSCRDSPFIYKFVLPKETSGSMINVLPAEKTVWASQLGPALLCLSPHHKWLSISAVDGTLYLQDSLYSEAFAQVCCHSYLTGGIGSMAFSLDGHTILTTGAGDGTVVCLTWRDPGNKLVREAFEYARTLSNLLQDTTFMEDEALRKMPSWSSDTNIPLVQVRQESQLGVEVTEQDDSYTSASLGQSPDPTWLDHKFTEAIKEQQKKYADQKKNLKNGIKELRQKIQAMTRENESLPDIEKLDQQEFSLDKEEQERHRDESQQEVERVRREIELENLSKQYLRAIIKKECWDLMSVRGRSVMSFHTEHEVTNYPLKERTTEELKDVARMVFVKKMEALDFKIRKEVIEVQAKTGIEEEEEVEDETEKSHGNTSLIGSLSDQYGGDTSNLYSQLEMHSREEKINQIILLQDIIYNMKTNFNQEFEAVYRQKEQEVARVKERNRRILEITSELHVQEKLLEPEFTVNENPERALTVDDSEIKVEKYLTPEQNKKAEQQLKQEEKRLAAQEDNAKQRALSYMMGGVLEVKKEDVLRMEVAQPVFLSKTETEWTEDEKKLFKDYEKKCKDLNEEKDKYRKILESEIKKIQASIMDSTLAFDEILRRLFEKKVNCEMVINQ